MKRIIKYISVILSGKAIAAGIGLLSFVLVARELSIAEFGLLMLIVSYKQITNRLVNFQTWQVIVKYGAAWKNDGSHDKFNQLLSFCFRLDALTAISAAIVGIVSAYALSHWIDWIAGNTHWIAIYCLVLVTNYRGYTTGIFRLFEKFNIQSGILILASLVKLIGVFILSYLDSGFQGYFFLWMLTDLAINIIEIFASYRITRANGYSPFVDHTTKVLRNDKSFLSFFISSNLDGMVKVLRELDTPIIASFLSVESAALYTVAKRFASVITMLADSAFEVIYPTTARLIYSNSYKDNRRLMTMSSALIGIPSLIITLLFLINGDAILLHTVGPNYDHIVYITTLCMGAATIWAFGFPLTANLMSSGHIKLVTINSSLSTAFYIIMLCALLPLIGINGAAQSLIFSQLTWLLITILFSRKIISNMINAKK